MALIGVRAYPRPRTGGRRASGFAARVRSPRPPSSCAPTAAPEVTVMPRLYMTLSSSAITPVQEDLTAQIDGYLTRSSSWSKLYPSPMSSSSERHTDDAVHRRTDL